MTRVLLLYICYTSILKSSHKRNKTNAATLKLIPSIYSFLVLSSTCILVTASHQRLEFWLAVFYTLNPALTNNGFNMHVDKPPKSLPSLLDFTSIDLYIHSTVAIHSMSIPWIYHYPDLLIAKIIHSTSFSPTTTSYCCFVFFVLFSALLLLSELTYIQKLFMRVKWCASTAWHNVRHKGSAQ